MKIKTILILTLLICCFSINNVLAVKSTVYNLYDNNGQDTIYNNRINILVKYKGSRSTVETLLSNINNINYTIAPPPETHPYDTAMQKENRLWNYLFDENRLSQEGFIKLKNSPYSLVKEHFTPDYIMIIYTEARQMPNGYQHKEEEYILVKLYDISTNIGRVIYTNSYVRKDFNTYYHQNDFGNIPKSLNYVISKL